MRISSTFKGNTTQSKVNARLRNLEYVKKGYICQTNIKVYSHLTSDFSESSATKILESDIQIFQESDDIQEAIFTIKNNINNRDTHSLPIVRKMANNSIMVTFRDKELKIFVTEITTVTNISPN